MNWVKPIQGFTFRRLLAVIGAILLVSLTGALIELLMGKAPPAGTSQSQTQPR